MMLMKNQMTAACYCCVLLQLQNNIFAGTFVTPQGSGNNLHTAQLRNNNFSAFALSGEHLSELDLQLNPFVYSTLSKFTSLAALGSLDILYDSYGVS